MSASLTGQIKYINRRRYCVISYTDHDVTLMSMDERKYIMTVPRTKMFGLSKGE